MTPTKTFGVRAGEQVSLHEANKQAARVDAALRARDTAAADAAAEAVTKALRAAEGRRMQPDRGSLARPDVKRG